MDQENEVSKIFIISLLSVWGAQERFFIFMWNSFKFLTHLESKMIQFEIIFKSLARFNTLKVLNSYLLWKLRTVGDKSQNRG